MCMCVCVHANTHMGNIGSIVCLMVVLRHGLPLAWTLSIRPVSPMDLSISLFSSSGITTT